MAEYLCSISPSKIISVSASASPVYSGKYAMANLKRGVVSVGRDYTDKNFSINAVTKPYYKRFAIAVVDDDNPKHKVF